MLLLQTTKWETIESCEDYLLGKNVAIGETKPFDQY